MKNVFGYVGISYMELQPKMDNVRTFFPTYVAKIRFPSFFTGTVVTRVRQQVISAK